MTDKILYCLKCDEFTTFRYNKVIGHSECIFCGSRYGVNKKNPVLIHFLSKEKTNVLCPKLAKLEKKIHNQKEAIKKLLVKEEKI